MVRIAVRSLRRSPWYAATTIGVIALSMSIATTVFAVVDGVLFKPLPYPDAAHLYTVSGGWISQPGLAISASPSDLLAWRQAVPEASFASASLGGRLSIDGGEPVRSAWVSPEFFDVIRQHPLIGGFRPEHFRPFVEGMPQPAIITYQAWQRRYAGDPSIVGRVVHGERDAITEIVGVMPGDFIFPSANGRFVPEALATLEPPKDPLNNRGRGLLVLARTPPTLTRDMFQARISAAGRDVAARFPKRPTERGPGPFDVVQVSPADEALSAGPRQMFVIAFVSAMLLVLLGCLNVAGLAATRVHDRHHELALRRALGGRQSDLVRLLAAEGAVIIGIGGALGVAGSVWLTRLTATLLPETLVLFKPLAVDFRVAAFALAAVAVCVGLTTIWPARAALSASLRSSLAGAGTVRRTRTFGRFAMVALQVAVGLVMAIVGALVAGSLARVWQEDPGYDPSRTVYLNLRSRTTTTMALNTEVLDAIRDIPGVVAAGGSNSWFMERAFNGTAFDEPAGAGPVPGHGIDDSGVTAGFFEASGLKLVAGRWPTPAELGAAEPLIVVNEITARTYWPGRSAIGQALTRKGQPFEVVGVVSNARHLALDIEPDGLIYYPMGVSTFPVLTTIFVRFADTGGLDPGLSALRSLLTSSRFPAYSVRNVMSVTGVLGLSVKQRRFQALVFSTFGTAAVIIVGVGVLGLVAMVTARRTREVGVRMALGAHPASIVGLIVRQEGAAVVAGAGAGGVAAWWAVRLVQSYLFRISTHDPVVWSAAAGVLISIAMAGAIIPALRASRIDPIRALRAE